MAGWSKYRERKLATCSLIFIAAVTDCTQGNF
jgi:hypothetical protein